MSIKEPIENWYEYAIIIQENLHKVTLPRLCGRLSLMDPEAEKWMNKITLNEEPISHITRCKNI